MAAVIDLTLIDCGTAGEQITGMFSPAFISDRFEGAMRRIHINTRPKYSGNKLGKSDYFVQQAEFLAFSGRSNG